MSESQGRGRPHGPWKRRMWAVLLVVPVWVAAAQVSHLQAHRRVAPAPVAGQLTWAAAALVFWPSRRHLEYLAVAVQARGGEKVSGPVLLHLCRSSHKLTELGYYAAAGYARRRCPDQAVIVAVRGTRRYPDSALMLYGLGRALVVQQRDAEGAAALEQAYVMTQRKHVARGLRRRIMWWRYRALLNCRSFSRGYAAARDGSAAFPADLRFLQGRAICVEGLGEPAAAAELWRALVARGGDEGHRALYDLCRLYGRLHKVREGELLLVQAAPRVSASWRHVCMAALVAPSAPARARRELQQVNEAELSPLGVAQSQLLRAVAPLWTQPRLRCELRLQGRACPDTTIYWYCQIYGLQAEAEGGTANSLGWLQYYEAQLRTHGNTAYYLDLRDICDGVQLRMPRLLGLGPLEGGFDAEPVGMMAARGESGTAA